MSAEFVTGKSFSEALILAPVKPQYDKRLFIEFPEKLKVHNMLCTKIVYCFCFDFQNNICSQNVVNLYFFFGHTDSRMKASEKDLPVHIH